MGINITALIGESGTGKSHHALRVASEIGAEAIIDDGLLIIGAKVAAGRSAKKEKTKMASVKRAVFFDPSHANSVKNTISENKVKALLILGTSKKMADRIVNALELGKINRYINIQDVSDSESIEIARRMRNDEGKHIIPVPTVEIKKDFSGYFLHPLQGFKQFRDGKNLACDNTVIRPTYSYLGEFTISDNAVNKIIRYAAKATPEVTDIYSVSVVYDKNIMNIDISVAIRYGTNIPAVCRKIRNKVIKVIDNMTAVNVEAVRIEVKNYSDD